MNINILKASKFYHKRLILILLGVIAGLIFVEISLRLIFFLGDKKLLGLRPSRTNITWQENSIVGNVLLSPHTIGWFVSPTFEYYTWIEANAEGFRDTEHQIEKPKGVFRILILGDSFVQNFQVVLQDTFFKQLERILNQNNQTKVEVIAMGLGNTGTDQQLLALENFGLKYQPNLIVHLFFTGNDITNNYYLLNQNPNLPYFDISGKDNLAEIPIAKTSKGKLFILKKFIKNLYIVQFALNLRQKIQEKPNYYHVYDKVYSRDFEKAWEITKKVILESQNISQQHGSHYILINLANNEQVNPDTYQINSQADLKKPDNIMSDFCQEEKLDCLFMLPFFMDFKRQNPSIRTHYRLDGHWNKIGTNLASEFLTQNLEKYLRESK